MFAAAEQQEGFSWKANSFWAKIPQLVDSTPWTPLRGFRRFDGRPRSQEPPRIRSLPLNSNAAPVVPAARKITLNKQKRFLCLPIRRECFSLCFCLHSNILNIQNGQKLKFLNSRLFSPANCLERNVERERACLN